MLCSFTCTETHNFNEPFPGKLGCVLLIFLPSFPNHCIVLGQTKSYSRHHPAKCFLGESRFLFLFRTTVLFTSIYIRHHSICLTYSLYSAVSLHSACQFALIITKHKLTESNPSISLNFSTSKPIKLLLFLLFLLLQWYQWPW